MINKTTIRERKALKKDVKKNFRPRLKSLFHGLKFLEIVPIENIEELNSVLERIADSHDHLFKNDIDNYKRYVELANLHNADIKQIDEFVDNWDIEFYLDSKNTIDQSEIDRLLSICEKIKKYKTKDYRYTSFLLDVKKIRKDITKINSILRDLDDYRKLIDIPKYEYIDSKRKNKLTGDILHCLSNHKRIKLRYYDPSDHSHIIKVIEKHNKECIDFLSNNAIFDDVNGKSLDNEQRKAVVSNEQSVLVVAGAGSGKTLTICGKVKFLLESGNVKPEDILLLSYSKKSADDLQSKVSNINKKLTVGTFHKIGLDILKETTEKTFMVEDQYKAIIEEYFRVEMKNRPHMLEKILTYYGLYLSTTKHNKKYKTEGDLFNDLKKNDFTTLKTQLLSMTDNFLARETIKKELVKSFEEMAIANWYFINGIEYIYESPYEKDVSTSKKRQYMPDFKLKNYPIYHEHYGVDKNGHASQYEGHEAAEYVRGMQWKREIHKKCGTDCIETYSYEFEDGTIFAKLEKQLRQRGVTFNPLSDKQILDALNSIYEKRAFKSFINLIRTFLSLYKATYNDDSTLDKLAISNFSNAYERKRTVLFLDIVKDIYHYYIDYLKKEDKIDFDDMILQSIKALDNLDTYRYKYIIVDEFQDISISRMRFLKRLIQQGNSKLFAVGDDWQAIYRFSGCDLSLFLEFSKYFGDSVIASITSTHRNSQELQDIAGPFIKKNPEQFNKTIHSVKHLDKPVRVMYYKDKKYYAFLDTLREISKMNPNASVLVLGRNNKDLEDILLDNRISIVRDFSDDANTFIKCTSFPKMEIKYSTVHGSKGLEDDFVILINADDELIGFPNKMEDDELLDLVLSHKSAFEYAEERRLWYVALTRTRSYTYIIANEEKPSIFLKEIIKKCLVLNSENNDGEIKTEISCPRCKTGKLVLRTNENDKTKFYGCSNYPYCNYSIDDMKAVARNKRCPNCGDFMIYRKGKHGSFYGCHNYPRCQHTEEYKKND
jgi:DNA helicase-4